MMYPFVKSLSAKTLTSTAILSLLILVTPLNKALAQSFTVPENTTLTGNQTLNNGTGIIGTGGLLQNGGTTISIVGGGASTLTNNGTITSTTGRGVDIGNGPGTTVTNNGTITTNTNEAILADSLQSGFTITNTGTLNTTGGITETFDLGGNSSTFNNSGTVLNGGTSANSTAVRFRGDNNTGVNSGLISATGNNGTGLSFNGGDNNTFTNSGIITATGDNATALSFNGGNTNTFTNNGTISATGANGTAVDFAGTTTNTFTNNGLISATGAATQAIIGGTGDQTLNLGGGSQIIGSVDLGAGNDTVNLLEFSARSSVVTFANTENINIASNVSGGAVVIGNTLVTVDPTGQSFLGQAVSTLNTSIHRSINKRINANTNTPDNGKSTIWGDIFGSTLERDGEGATLSYEQDYYGFVGGYEQDAEIGRLGLVFGLSSSNIDTDTQSIDTDVLSFFGGVYGHFDVGSLTLSTNFILGYEDYDNERAVLDNLNGVEIADSDFNNIFISPSVSISTGYKINKNFELRPSATLTYTASFFDDYNESGTTSANLSVDSRNVQTLNTRVQLAGVITRGKTEFELRLGFDGRFDDTDDIDASLGGTDFEFSTSDDDSVLGGFIGLGVKIYDANGLSLVADTEYRDASGGENEFSGNLRASYNF